MAMETERPVTYTLPSSPAQKSNESDRSSTPEPQGTSSSAASDLSKAGLCGTTDDRFMERIDPGGGPLQDLLEGSMEDFIDMLDESSDSFLEELLDGTANTKRRKLNCPDCPQPFYPPVGLTEAPPPQLPACQAQISTTRAKPSQMLPAPSEEVAEAFVWDEFEELEEGYLWAC